MAAMPCRLIHPKEAKFKVCPDKPSWLHHLTETGIGVSTMVKARRGSGFYEIFCIFANMSCLCIHLVTLFNLPCKKKLSWNLFFML